MTRTGKWINSKAHFKSCTYMGLEEDFKYILQDISDRILSEEGMIELKKANLTLQRGKEPHKTNMLKL